MLHIIENHPYFYTFNVVASICIFNHWLLFVSSIIAISCVFQLSKSFSYFPTWFIITRKMLKSHILIVYLSFNYVDIFASYFVEALLAAYYIRIVILFFFLVLNEKICFLKPEVIFQGKGATRRSAILKITLLFSLHVIHIILLSWWATSLSSGFI